MRIRSLSATDAAGCDAIVTASPHFFGLESGAGARAEAVRTQTGARVERAKASLAASGVGVPLVLPRAGSGPAHDVHEYRPAGWEQSAQSLVRPLG